MKQKIVTPDNKLLLSLIHKNKIVSDVKRAKLFAATSDFNKINSLSEERLAKISTATIKRVGVAVTVTNTQTNEIKKFNNQTEAGQFIGVTRQAINKSIKRNKPIKNILIIKKD